MRTRNALLGTADAATRTVPVTLSSEYPVDRDGFMEVLSHEPGDVDLVRVPLPLLEVHDTRRINIGVVEDLRLSGKKLRGIARFGSSARALELWKDVLDGIVRSVSVGYELLGDGRPREGVQRFSWRPLECSIVPIPADPTVGFFRSKELMMDNEMGGDALTRSQRRAQRQAEVREEREAQSGEERERLRVRALLALKGRGEIDEEMAGELIEDGVSIEDACKMVLQLKAVRGKGEIVQAAVRRHESRSGRPSGYAAAGMPRSDLHSYSFLRAIACQLPDATSEMKRRAELEIEMSRAATRDLGYKPEGIFVPIEVLMHRRDLNVGTAVQGGNLVQTTVDGRSFVDVLRAAAPVMQMATVLQGLQGNLALPRKTASSAVAWVAEGTAPSEGAITFDQIAMAPKTVAGTIDVTKRLILQSSPGVESLMEDDLAQGVSQAIEIAAINGSGTGNTPRGILQTAGIGSVAGGTNGAAPTWDHIADLEAALGNANADRGGLAYLVNSKTRTKLKKTQRFSGTNGEPVWSDTGLLNGRPTMVTNNVPATLTKGTASGICSAIIFGNFKDLIIGIWGGMDLVVDPYTQANAGIVRVSCRMEVDIALRHPESFAAMLDALS